MSKIRYIEAHRAVPTDTNIIITTLDEPGSGGAYSHYMVDLLGCPEHSLDIHFQKMPLPTIGVDGIQMEVLMAICIDRLECFQEGPFACGANAAALTYLRHALQSLHGRTRERLARKVTGKLEK